MCVCVCVCVCVCLPVQVHQMKSDHESTEHSWFKILRRKIMGSDYSDLFVQWKYEPNFEIGNVVE